MPGTNKYFLLKFRKARLLNWFTWISLLSFISALCFFSGICRGCHKSFFCAFIAKWYLQAKETSTQVRKVSFVFVLLICTFWRHRARLALQPSWLLLRNVLFFWEESGRERCLEPALCRCLVSGAYHTHHKARVLFQQSLVWRKLL